MQTDQYTDMLRASNLRVTPARVAVLHIIDTSDTPLDVGELLQTMKKHHVRADEATVFRIVHTFLDKGMVQPVQFRDGKLRYESATKPKHHHFVCEQCGSVTDIQGCVVADYERTLQHTLGVTVTRHSLEFFGTCRRCTT